MMRKYNIIILVLVCYFLQACLQDESKTKELSKSKYYKVTTQPLNDSTIEYSNWIDSHNADCFLICRTDTLDRYFYTQKDLYYNYTHYKKSGTIYKIKQFVDYLGDIQLNEIIHFKQEDSSTVNDESSFYIKCLSYGDSVKLTPFPLGYFNKVVVIVGDNKNFNSRKWVNNDTLVSLKNYIIISKKYMNKKYCMLQGITTDEHGEDKSGKDYYFDLKNLLCRDVKKSLLCKD